MLARCHRAKRTKVKRDSDATERPYIELSLAMACVPSGVGWPCLVPLVRSLRGNLQIARRTVGDAERGLLAALSAFVVSDGTEAVRQ